MPLFPHLAGGIDRLARHSRLGIRLDRIFNDKQQVNLKVATAADENGVDTIVRPGLVNHWNKLQTEQAQPKLRIQPGDRITAVNHSSEYKNMLEQLGKAPRLTLSIERDREHGVLTPLPNLSSAHQKHPASQIDGLASRQRSLPSLPPMKCDKHKLSISECSTRESTPRKAFIGGYSAHACVAPKMCNECSSWECTSRRVSSAKMSRGTRSSVDLKSVYQLDA